MVRNKVLHLSVAGLDVGSGPFVLDFSDRIVGLDLQSAGIAGAFRLDLIFLVAYISGVCNVVQIVQPFQVRH